MVSILPVSGAEQLNTSLAQGTRPMISASGAYSGLVRPAPSEPDAAALSTGRNRFHRPAARALGLGFSMVARADQRLPAAGVGARSGPLAGSAGGGCWCWVWFFFQVGLCAGGEGAGLFRRGGGGGARGLGLGVRRGAVLHPL